MVKAGRRPGSPTQRRIGPSLTGIWVREGEVASSGEDERITVYQAGIGFRHPTGFAAFCFLLAVGLPGLTIAGAFTLASAGALAVQLAVFLVHRRLRLAAAVGRAPS